ncbi:hypothetical protein [Rugosimonospora africana]|uniref:Uncharacterized protein n=1 Tax=Rugosimonospora africana TaxID=556532 RepID=A0A8J3QRG8_9ACTN|nr:hypothetical protein [Rugosimonospora africana]GIH16110.1 hypothetical protein Raf01_42820 [Rugosimonospora africana]
MGKESERSRTIIVQDEMQGPLAPLDFGPLFAAARGTTAGESIDDGAETTELPSSDDANDMD